MVRMPSLESMVITRVDASGVELTLRYLCMPINRRKSEHKIWEDILNAFEGHVDIDFAYPTERRFNHLAEGKVAMEIKKNESSKI